MADPRSEKIRTLVLTAADPQRPEEDRHKAFEGLVAAFQDMAFACAFSRLGDFHLAENAAQEAFILAWRKLAQLREPAAFPGWLRRLVLSQCGRITRSSRSDLPLEGGEMFPSNGEDPHVVLERAELTHSMHLAIRKLPQNERVAVILFYLNDYSHSEISSVLDVAVTTVAKRLYSARERLRGRFPLSVKEAYMSRRPSSDRSFAKKVLAGIYDEYLGEYRYDERPEMTVVVTKQKDKLIAESNGQRNQLFASSRTKNELRAKEFDGRGKFVRDESGSITHFIYYEFGQEMGRATKIR